MLRCHRRKKLLAIVLSELRRYQEEGLASIQIHAMADRPAPGVTELLAENRDLIRTVWHPDFPILSPRGERFREAKREQLAQIQAWHIPIDWVLLQDDDRWLEPIGATRELPAALSDPDADLWNAKSLFLWDDSNIVNLHRHHLGPLLFRFRACDHFPLDRDIQAPLPLHDEAHIKRRVRSLSTPLLDAGTQTQDERERVFQAFFDAKKRDDYTYSIVEDPELVPLDLIIGRPWKDLLHASSK